VGALGFTFLAIIMTLATAFLLAKVMGTNHYAGEPVETIVVAAVKIPAAERINESHLKVVNWPKASIPEGAFTSIDDFLGPDPRVPARTILEGEPILGARLASTKSGTGMASLVPPEKRAFPVPVDPWVGTARLIYPGSEVDVLTTIRNPGSRQMSTKLVLQKLKVLSVDGVTDSAGQEKEEKKDGLRKKSVVTLLVDPEEAEVLTLASREGKIDVMLRNTNDESIVETFGISAPELLGEADQDEVEEALQAQKDSDKRRARSRRRRSRRPTKPVTKYPKDDQPRFGSRRGSVKHIDLGGQQ